MGRVKTFITEDGKEVPYLENPIPMPPKHIKKSMDFDIETDGLDDDFDHDSGQNDDFDIK